METNRRKREVKLEASLKQDRCNNIHKNTGLSVIFSLSLSLIA